MGTTVLEGGHIYAGGPSRTEYAGGHVTIEGNRITGVGGGSPVHQHPDRRIDVSGCLITPGLVNTHHHFYQWVTRGLAVDGTLFEWLTKLYPVWANLDEDVTRTAATAALARLARTGCTTSTDHHYVFPHHGGDLLGAEIEAARTVGLRFHPARGSMDLGQSDGGLPPDQVVEDLDSILTASEKAIQTHHDASFDSMLRIARPMLALLRDR